MKKVLVILILLVLSISAFAQIEVKQNSFKEVQGFVNINPDPDYQTDDNDLPFAVIKVKTENITDKQRRELRFEGNSGTFFMLEYKTGEVWVYLTAKYANYIKISHPDFSSTEFTLPEDLKAKKGYELTLVNTTTASLGSGSITIETKPEDGASITLNGMVLNKTTPYNNDMVAAGQYEVSVSKERYKTATQTFYVNNGEMKNIEINMQLDIAIITLNADEYTSVYIDGEFKGFGTWIGELYSGQHEVEYRKKYHTSDFKTINVVAEQNETFELYPKPVYGKISISSEPQGAIIYIDNIEYGKTPLQLDNIIIGNHEIMISKNKYKTTTKRITIEESSLFSLVIKLDNCPTGTINGVFSVSDDKKVYFSQGNLQNQSSTNSWRFADYQWECIGGYNMFGWTDYFLWGSDYKNRQNIGTKEKDENNKKNNISGTKHDWGVYNTIDNGDNNVKWHTLTKNEWFYLLYERITDTGVRFAKALVNNERGIIILPDIWKRSYDLSNVNDETASFNSNIISKNDWIDNLEANGAVFLPVAGYWSYSGGSYHCLSLKTSGYYWTASCNSVKDVWYLYFDDKVLQIHNGMRNYSYYYCVRLVCNAN